MSMTLRQMRWALLASACALSMIDAQTPSSSTAPTLRQPLSEFEGQYRYRDGGTLFIVSDGARLVALLGEAKYPLRAVACVDYGRAQITAAVARQSRVDDSDYGLGIWHRWYNVSTPAGSQRVETIMLSGNGGQKVYIVPSLDLVVVFTGGAFNAESPVNTLMARTLLPALLTADGEAVRK